METSTGRKAAVRFGEVAGGVGCKERDNNKGRESAGGDSASGVHAEWDQEGGGGGIQETAAGVVTDTRWVRAVAGGMNDATGAQEGGEWRVRGVQEG